MQAVFPAIASPKVIVNLFTLSIELEVITTGQVISNCFDLIKSKSTLQIGVPAVICSPALTNDSKPSPSKETVPIPR